MIHGASRDEWLAFAGLGLTPDLLPVVSNPQAKISPGSKMAGLGKTPSRYNSNRFVSGFAQWTAYRANEADVDRWSGQPDYGICIQTRNVRALDIDVPDKTKAQAIVDRFEELLGMYLPMRSRAGTGKTLLAFRLPGDFSKRSFPVDGGIVEFLATGQQFIAIGTHKDKENVLTRYEWIGGLPTDIPEISVEVFEAAWAQLVAEFAIDKELRSAGGVRERGERIDGVVDPVVKHLEANRGDLIRGHARDYVELWCPWSAEHSGDSGPSETIWMLPDTKNPTGNFKCQHGHCAERHTGTFLAEIGYAEPVEDMFEDLGDAPEDPRTFIDRGDVMLAARSAYQTVWTTPVGSTLLRSGGAWFAYRGTHYAEQPDELVRNRLWTYLDTLWTKVKVGKTTVEEKYKPSANLVGGAADALRSVAFSEATAPSWLRGSGAGLEPRECMAMTNGILHVPTRTLLPHTPDFFTLNALPYAWEPEGEKPTRWLRFLDEVWPGDQEAIDTMQEIMGYSLLPDTSFQKMFMVVGPKRSGKGTINRVMTAMLGAHNVSSPSIQTLTSDFGLEPLIGKLVAMVPDGRAGARTDTHAFVERLLSISGEDSLNINRKNKQFWIGKLDTRIVMFLNQTPRLGDTSGALPGRFIHLAMRESFYDSEDTGLTPKLREELPAILRWALDGRDRLYARGYFVQPESGKENAEDMADMGNPVGQFLNDCCELDPEASESIGTLYEAWRSWCGTTGHTAGARETFGRSLRVAAPKVRRTQSRAMGRAYVYQGIGVNGYAGDKAGHRNAGAVLSVAE